MNARNASRWLVPLGTVLVTLLVFLPALKNGFVDWDDKYVLLTNTGFRSFSGENIKWMWSTFYMGVYMPITWASFGLDYLLWKLNPFGYHLTNVALHAANAVLVYFLVLRFSALSRAPADDRRAALRILAGLSALFFSIHPLRVESVAWVTERKDVLAGAFALSSVLAYFKYAAGGSRRTLWAAVALFACSLLSKPSAIGLPLILPLLDAHPLRRRMDRGLLFEKIPFALLSAACVPLALYGQLHDKGRFDPVPYAWAGRAAQTCVGILFPLRKSLWPFPLSPLYEKSLHMGFDQAPVLLSGLAVAALTIAAVGVRRRFPGGFTAWFSYLILVLPTAGIVQSGPQVAADRYSYLPSVVLSAGAGVLFSGAFCALAAALILAVLGFLTIRQIPVWSGPMSLWSRVVDVEPSSSYGNYNLGNLYRDAGQVAPAMAHYRLSLLKGMWPADWMSNFNMGALSLGQGKPREALGFLEQAAALNPGDAMVRMALGRAYLDEGRFADALRYYREAIALDPAYADADVDLGYAYLTKGEKVMAAYFFRRALAIKPDSPEAAADLKEALK